MHEPPGELEGTLDRVQSILTLHTHALCERTQGHTADPNEPVNRREEPGAAASCFFPPGRMQAPGEPPPPPLPLGSKLRLPGSQLSPAEAPHRAGRKPAARTAAAMVEAHERLRPSSLPTAWRDCSPSTGRGPRPETESPSPGAAPQRSPDPSRLLKSGCYRSSNYLAAFWVSNFYGAPIHMKCESVSYQFNC